MASSKVSSGSAVLAPLLLCLAVAACSGSPVGGTASPTPTPSATPTPSIVVNGITRDYFTTGTLEDMIVDTRIGIVTTSGIGGAYTVTVPPSTAFSPTVDSGLYRETTNLPVPGSTTTPITFDLFAASTVDINRQYTAAGFAAGPGTAVLIADLIYQGTPLSGVAEANIQLLDGTMTGVGYGPYFFGSAGDIDPAIMTSVVYDGRSRIAILDCPVGTATLKVQFLDGAATVTLTEPVSLRADGVTLARTHDP